MTGLGDALPVLSTAPAGLTEHTVAQEAPPAAYAVTNSARRQYPLFKKQMRQSKSAKLCHQI